MQCDVHPLNHQGLVAYILAQALSQLEKPSSVEGTHAKRLGHMAKKSPIMFKPDISNSPCSHHCVLMSSCFLYSRCFWVWFSLRLLRLGCNSQRPRAFRLNEVQKPLWHSITRVAYTFSKLLILLQNCIASYIVHLNIQFSPFTTLRTGSFTPNGCWTFWKHRITLAHRLPPNTHRSKRLPQNCLEREDLAYDQQQPEEKEWPWIHSSSLPRTLLVKNHQDLQPMEWYMKQITALKAHGENVLWGI